MSMKYLKIITSLVFVLFVSFSSTTFADTSNLVINASVTRSGDAVNVVGTVKSLVEQDVALEIVFMEETSTEYQNQSDTLVTDFFSVNEIMPFDVAIIRLDPKKSYFWKIAKGGVTYKTGSINGTGTSSTTGSTGTPPPIMGTITVNNAAVTATGTNLKVSGSIVSTANRSATLRVKYGTSASTMTATAAGNFFSGSLVANQTRTVPEFLISNGIQAGTVYYVQIYDANDTSKVFTGPLSVTTSGTPQGGSGADPQGGTGGDPQGGSGADPQGGTTTGTTTGGDTNLENPLQVSSLWGFLEAVLGWIVKIGAVIVGVFFVISGFKFVAAQGNEEKLSDAKRGFVYTVIGAVLLLGAWTLATIISSTVAEIAR
jgi:hypothetical protein